MTSRTRAAGKMLIALALVATLAGCTNSAPQSAPPTTSAPAPTPTPTPSAPPAPPARMAAAAAVIADWSLAPDTALAEVTPAAGDAATGSTSLLVHAPAVAEPTVAAESRAAVSAGQSLQLSVTLRTLDGENPAGALVVRAGGVDTPLPATRARDGWTTFSAPIAPTSDTELVQVVAVEPVTRVAIDDLEISVGGGSNLVPNSSFEHVSTGSLIANASLIVSTGHSALAVSGEAGPVDYSIATQNGDVVASGSTPGDAALEAVALDEVPQGYYDVTVRSSAGEQTAPLALIASETYDIARDDRFGAFVHTSLEKYEGYGRYAASLGMSAIRSDIAWVRNEKTRGEYTWDSLYEGAFDRVRANDLELLGIIDYGNPLYGNPMVPDTPEAIAAYGRYARAVVERYSPEAIEVFNEFNHPPFNNGACGRTADCYNELVSAVVDNVSQSDQETRIVVGATANYNSDWFNRLADVGGMDGADAVSFHPYSANGSPERVISMIDDAQQISESRLGDPLPVWITETGTSAKTGSRTPEQQASFLIRMEVNQLAAGVERLFWYELQNAGTDRAAHYDNFGLFSMPQSSQSTWEPKPAAFTQAMLIATLNGRAFEETLDLGDSTVAYAFGTSPRVIVAWSTDGEREVRISSEDPLTVTTVEGVSTVVEPTDGEVTVTLSGSPRFIDQVTEPEN